MEQHRSGVFWVLSDMQKRKNRKPLIFFFCQEQRNKKRVMPPILHCIFP